MGVNKLFPVQTEVIPRSKNACVKDLKKKKKRYGYVTSTNAEERRKKTKQKPGLFFFLIYFFYSHARIASAADGSGGFVRMRSNGLGKDFGLRRTNCIGMRSKKERNRNEKTFCFHFVSYFPLKFPSLLVTPTASCSAASGVGAASHSRPRASGEGCLRLPLPQIKSKGNITRKCRNTRRRTTRVIFSISS